MESNTIHDMVLVSPPSRMINHYRPPIGLMYVGGYMQHRGLDIKIIDVPMKDVVRNKEFYKNMDSELEKIEQQMIEEFRRLKTKTVGIAFYTPEYYEVYRLARAFKEIDPNVKVIVGGIHPTLYPEEVLTEEGQLIDYAIIGEGEITSYELVHAIVNGENDFANIQGIAYRNPTTQEIVKTVLRPLCEDIDEVSHPAYNLIDMDYYTNASPYAIRGCFLRSMYLLATRGCPSQCSFCVAKKLRTFTGGGKYTRVRSAGSLIREILELKNKHSIDSFYFIDDLFTINKKNVLEFCNEIIKRKISVLWGCSSKVSTLDEEVIRNMAEAGCVQIDFGVERGSDEALDYLKKGISVKKIKEVFHLCHKYKIRTFANFLVNLPEETEKDLNDIIILMDEIKPEIVSLNIFTPYPGTEIYENAPYKFTKEEYPMLAYATTLVYTDPEKLKFAKHDINLMDWTHKYHKHYNRITDNIKFYLSFRYWATLLRSGRKSNYLKNSILLIKEVINQKI